MKADSMAVLEEVIREFLVVGQQLYRSEAD
jgi:hypothetical protein